jgi:hypothetical protein
MKGLAHRLEFEGEDKVAAFRAIFKEFGLYFKVYKSQLAAIEQALECLQLQETSCEPEGSVGKKR